MFIIPKYDDLTKNIMKRVMNGDLYKVYILSGKELEHIDLPTYNVAQTSYHLLKLYEVPQMAPYETNSQHITRS